MQWKECRQKDASGVESQNLPSAAVDRGHVCKPSQASVQAFPLGLWWPCAYGSRHTDPPRSHTGWSKFINGKLPESKQHVFFFHDTVSLSLFCSRIGFVQNTTRWCFYVAFLDLCFGKLAPSKVQVKGLDSKGSRAIKDGDKYSFLARRLDHTGENGHCHGLGEKWRQPVVAF